MIPVVARIASPLCRVKVPTRTRNSLTNVLMPGSASADRPASRKSPPRMGVTLAARDQDADDEEQRPGREGMVHHVEDGSGAALCGEGEDADADESEVRH